MIDETQLALQLNLPPPDLHQDWGVEFASPERVESFIESLASLNLTPRAEFILLELILASIDEGLETGLDIPTDETLAFLVSQLSKHQLLQEYWLADKFSGEFPVVQLLNEFQQRRKRTK